MKDQFVTYEIALALKELGFSTPCFSAYTENGNLMDIGNYFNDDIIGELEGHSYYISCLAPLWQQVIDWFRDEHDIVIEIARQKYFDTYANSYAYEVVCKVYKNKELEGSVVIRDNKNNHIFYSYEEAREQAILKCIELCQNKN